MRLTVLAVSLALACAFTSAEARPISHLSVKHLDRHIGGQAPGCSDPVMKPCVGADRPVYFARGNHRKANKHRHKLVLIGQKEITHHITFLTHPAGCPARAFCGCGAAVRVFGKPIRNLWLARNWFRFPRAVAAAGMVAVRRHHVFVLERHISGSTWLAYDANSGGRRTRIHPRSVAGFAIVNPHGSRMAAQW